MRECSQSGRSPPPDCHLFIPCLHLATWPHAYLHLLWRGEAGRACAVGDHQGRNWKSGATVPRRLLSARCRCHALQRNPFGLNGSAAHAVLSRFQENYVPSSASHLYKKWNSFQLFFLGPRGSSSSLLPSYASLKHKCPPTLNADLFISPLCCSPRFCLFFVAAPGEAGGEGSCRGGITIASD